MAKCCYDAFYTRGLAWLTISNVMEQHTGQVQGGWHGGPRRLKICTYPR